MERTKKHPDGMRKLPDGDTDAHLPLINNIFRQARRTERAAAMAAHSNGRLSSTLLRFPKTVSRSLRSLHRFDRGHSNSPLFLPQAAGGCSPLIDKIFRQTRRTTGALPMA